jgi:hypothetical protein
MDELLMVIPNKDIPLWAFREKYFASYRIASD